MRGRGAYLGFSGFYTSCALNPCNRKGCNFPKKIGKNDGSGAQVSLEAPEFDRKPPASQPNAL